MASYAGTMDGHEAYGGGHGGEKLADGDRMYGVFLNLLPLLTLTGFAWVLVLAGSIVMWRIKAKESAFLDAHGREVTNFVISLGLWVGLIAIGSLILVIGTLGIAAPLILLVIGLSYVAGLVVILVGSIRGAIAAHNGQLYRFPVTFRVLG